MFQFFSNYSSFNRYKRMLQTNIQQDQASQFSVVTLSQSTLSFENSSFLNNSCLNQFCNGGSLLLINSGGNIKNCHFTNNQCFGNGGAINILNINQQLNVENSFFNDNLANEGKGGGLSFISNSDQYEIKLQRNIFKNNTAQYGGGVYFEFQDNSQKQKIISYIYETFIIYNMAKIVGGGIYYYGRKPQIDSVNSVNQNQAQNSFGKNIFSIPKYIQLNCVEPFLNYTTYYDNLGEKIYKISNQVSGKELPSLLFLLIDEEEQKIDSSYIRIAQNIGFDLTLTINKADNLSNSPFSITSFQKQFEFIGYYNVSNLVVTGIPGQSVFLVLTVNFLSQKINYRILLEIELRPCIRGEIYNAYEDDTYNPPLTLYSCQKCEFGKYSLVYPNLNNTNIECKKCSIYANCPGGYVIDVRKGYWRVNDQTDEIIECINAPDNCDGGTSNFTCSNSHIGPLCESCDLENNFSSVGNFECGLCSNKILNFLKILGLVFLYVKDQLIFYCNKGILIKKQILSAKISVDGVIRRLFFILEIKNHLKKQEQQNSIQDTSALLKLFLNYFQIIMVLSTFQINIPTKFSDSISAISNPTTIIFYSFQCFFYQLYLDTGINVIYIQIIFSIVLPFVCFWVFFITGSILYRNNPTKKSLYLNTSFLYCFIYFQPSIFKNALSLVKCRSIGQAKYIQFNVMNECDTDEYYQWSLSLVIPIILLFGLITPLFIAILIRKSQKSQKKSNTKKYILMTSEYQEKFWYWEFIKMYMKLFIMFFLIFYEYNIPNKVNFQFFILVQHFLKMQISFVFFIVCMYGILLILISPYKTKSYEKLDLLQTVIMCFSIYFGFVAYQNKQTIFWWLFMIIIIAIINLFYVFWCFRLITKAYIYSQQSKIEKLMIFFLKFSCCKRYFFSQKTKMIYLRKRWVKSFQQLMKEKNMINLWTGKLKVEKEQVIKSLLGEEYIKKQQSQTSLPKSKKQIQQNNELQGDFRSFIQSQSMIENSTFQLQTSNIVNQQISQFLAKKTELYKGIIQSDQLLKNKIQSKNEIFQPKFQLENSNLSLQFQIYQSPDKITYADSEVQGSIFDEQKIDESLSYQLDEEKKSIDIKQNDFKILQKLKFTKKSTFNSIKKSQVFQESEL